MREFFHGWRRKAGVVTLVMALVLMGGWIRSFSTRDLIQWRISERTTVFVFSNRSFLVWQAIRTDSPQYALRGFCVRSSHDSPHEAQNATSTDYTEFFDIALNPSPQNNSFHFNPQETRITAWKFQYWLVTPLLSLLTAYLLLWTPRERTRSDHA